MVQQQNVKSLWQRVELNLNLRVEREYYVELPVKVYGAYIETRLRLNVAGKLVVTEIFAVVPAEFIFVLFILVVG